MIDVLEKKLVHLEMCQKNYSQLDELEIQQKIEIPEYSCDGVCNDTEKGVGDLQTLTVTQSSLITPRHLLWKCKYIK